MKREEEDILNFLFQMDIETEQKEICENRHFFNKGKYDYCPICGSKLRATTAADLRKDKR